MCSFHNWNPWLCEWPQPRVYILRDGRNKEAIHKDTSGISLVQPEISSSNSHLLFSYRLPSSLMTSFTARGSPKHTHMCTHVITHVHRDLWTLIIDGQHTKLKKQTAKQFCMDSPQTPPNHKVCISLTTPLSVHLTVQNLLEVPISHRVLSQWTAALICTGRHSKRHTEMDHHANVHHRLNKPAL